MLNAMAELQYRVADRSTHTAAHWQAAMFARHRGPDLVCTLCPHACALADGETGPCRVRRRAGQHLETATLACAVEHLQPIERSALYHVRPGSQVLALAAGGCTMTCDHCLNHRLARYKPELETVPVVTAAVVDRARSADAAIVLTYSEPVLMAELTIELAGTARAAGVELLWSTNGFITPGALKQLAPLLRAVNVDLKAADPKLHRRLTGADNGPVFVALQTLRDLGVWVEVSTPVIPGVNSDPAEVRAMIRHLLELGPDTPWHLLRFIPARGLAHLGPTPTKMLVAIRNEARQLGLQHVYVARALGESGRTTCCPDCGSAVVRRSLRSRPEIRLESGCCPDCATPIAGIW